MKHGGVPFWVICNDMTFGQIVTFYEHLDCNLQEKISFDLSTFLQDNLQNITNIPSKNIISVSTLLNLLKNANEFRNIAAHNNLLFNHRCWKNLKTQKWMPLNASKCNKQGLYFVFLYLRCLLSSSQYAVLHNTILKRVNTLKKKLYSIPISKVLISIDFPADWNTSEKILQNNISQKSWKTNLDKIKNQNRTPAEKNKFKTKYY